MSVISNFEEINLKPYSLVVLDIDDTLIYFEKINFEWWKEKFEFYYNLYKDFDLAEKQSYVVWLEEISKIRPKLTDEKIFSFFENCEKNNCKVILLTARKEIVKDITIKQLHECGLIFNKDDVYFDENKGDRIKTLIKITYNNFDNIIFVDDLESNLTDVKNSILDKNLTLYKFINHKN